jgi:hypothetical protein
MRSIQHVITNYVMHVQPITYARPGGRIVAAAQNALHPRWHAAGCSDDLMITDGESVTLAAIMGGLESGPDDDRASVNFEPIASSDVSVGSRS